MSLEKKPKKRLGRPPNLVAAKRVGILKGAEQQGFQNIAASLMPAFFMTQRESKLIESEIGRSCTVGRPEEFHNLTPLTVPA
jgi:hypothetical protein